MTEFIIKMGMLLTMWSSHFNTTQYFEYIWGKTCDQWDRLSLILAARKRLGLECMWRIHVRAVSQSQCSAMSAMLIETPQIEFHIQDQEKAFLSLKIQWAFLLSFMWYDSIWLKWKLLTSCVLLCNTVVYFFSWRVSNALRNWVKRWAL